MFNTISYSIRQCEVIIILILKDSQTLGFPTTRRSACLSPLNRTQSVLHWTGLHSTRPGRKHLFIQNSSKKLRPPSSGGSFAQRFSYREFVWISISDVSGAW